MKYIYLLGKDTHPGTLLFDDDQEAIRPLYKQFCCSACGKPRELECLESGLPPELAFKPGLDYQDTDDCFTIISARFDEILHKKHIPGMRTFAFPDDPAWFAAWPAILAPVDLQKSGYERIEPKCKSCGRYSELATGGCFLRGLTPPQDDCIFSPEVFAETCRSVIPQFFATESIVKRLRPYKLKGLRFYEVPPP